MIAEVGTGQRRSAGVRLILAALLVWCATMLAGLLGIPDLGPGPAWTVRVAHLATYPAVGVGAALERRRTGASWWSSLWAAVKAIVCLLLGL